MGEFLGALGLAWPRLFLYPGGISALLLAWLLNYALARGTAGETRQTTKATRCAQQPTTWGLSFVVAPLLAISLLPLPAAGYFPYGLDIPTTLALLEWPRLIQLARHGHDDAETCRRTLTAGYGLLLLAALALAQQTGSFGLAALLRDGATADMIGLALRYGGIAGWTGAILLLIGAESIHKPEDWMLGWGLRLRVLGHLLLATLPWLPLLGAAPWSAALPPVGLALLLVAVGRWGRNIAPGYRRVVLASLALLLVALLSIAAYAGLLRAFL